MPFINNVKEYFKELQFQVYFRIYERNLLVNNYGYVYYRYINDIIISYLKESIMASSPT